MNSTAATPSPLGRNRRMEEIGRHFIEKDLKSGVSPEVAETVFGLIKGYVGTVSAQPMLTSSAI